MHALHQWYIQVVVLHKLVHWLAVTKPAIHINSAVVDGNVSYVFWKPSCDVCDEIGCLSCIVLATNRYKSW